MKKHLASLAAILLLTCAGTARAQEGQQAQESTEAQPGAARVSYINGDVSTQRGDNGDWVAVTLNAPVVSGDRVATGQNATAELQLDYADILRMSSGATAKVADLTRGKIQVQIGQGLVTYTVLKGGEAAPEIDTPNVAIHPLGEGEYRVLVNSDAETQVVIRRGSADISTPQGSTRAETGQLITIAGTDNPQYEATTAPGKDDWDRWNDERDHKITTAESWKHTDRYYTGSEDLDAYGVWSEVPDYGRVWVPRHDADWAPYRDGRWVYEPYYGWTWVSEEPWGWAPYHYGRWFAYGGDWVWWPGPVAVYPGYYPIWAPAYVSFFGFGGGGWGFGFGFGWGWGHVGWLPIGPGDWYHPWYGRWGSRVNVVSFTNIHDATMIHNGFRPLAGARGHQFSNINEALTNSRVRGGFSSMLGNQFGRGAVPAHQQSISAASFRQTSMMAGKMPIAPTRSSYSPTDRAANPSVARSVPPSSQRFFTPTQSNGRANTLAAHGGMNSAPQLNNSVRPQTPALSRPGNSVGTSTARDMNTGRAGNASTSQPNTRPGWHTFTPPSSSTINRQGQNTMGNARVPSGGNTSQRSFTPPTARESQGPQSANQGGWQHFPAPSRGSYSNTYRPPLNMRQPIVRPRNSPPAYSAPRGGTSGGSGGGYRGPSGGGHSAPSSGSGGVSHSSSGSHSSSRSSGGGHRH